MSPSCECHDKVCGLSAVWYALSPDLNRAGTGSAWATGEGLDPNQSDPISPDTASMFLAASHPRNKFAAAAAHYLVTATNALSEARKLHQRLHRVGLAI